LTWQIENLSPSPDGTRVDFTISHTANASSMAVFHNGIRQVQVAANPQPGEAEYGITATAVKMGIAPASGVDVWTRYFY